jgi:hypothetical protein
MLMRWAWQHTQPSARAVLTTSPQCHFVSTGTQMKPRSAVSTYCSRKTVRWYRSNHQVRRRDRSSTEVVITSPFRKLRIAESEHGLQNFTESGYGFRIYGIEVDMYGKKKLTDSMDSRIPCGFAKNGAPLPHAAAAPHRPPPTRPGHAAWPGAAPRRGTGRWQSVTAGHVLAVNELNNCMARGLQA